MPVLDYFLTVTRFIHHMAKPEVPVGAGLPANTASIFASASQVAAVHSGFGVKAAPGWYSGKTVFADKAALARPCASRHQHRPVRRALRVLDNYRLIDLFIP